MSNTNLDELCINTIRFLSVDAVEKAKSGHPGMPMGAAPLAYILWDRFLKHNPADPAWPDRDRFVLSAGHGSMLLYSLLYLTGHDISLEDIKQFRQWGSKTPGHPEHGITSGVEATTGPLGQGFANGVGMAMAERRLAALYNRPGFDVINHYTYAIVSDGDLEEGVASEAASLAGHLRLEKLIYLYDSNGVQQDGLTDASFTENVYRRFQSYGWRVIGPVDGLDLSELQWALNLAQTPTGCPTLIICKTIIGYGSPHKAGTNAAHGEPLGATEVKLAKEQLGWNYPEQFTVPGEVLAHLRRAVERGRLKEQEWRRKLEEYGKYFPREAARLESDLAGDLPDKWDEELGSLFSDKNELIATRDASGKILNSIASRVNSFLGGAADLAGSTRTLLNNRGDFTGADYTGCNLRFGLREHAMGAITNGLALHGGVIPFAASFLIFSDYMRPPMRLAALMRLRVIYVFTHDSIALGEDGPTHQPVEQIMGLRLIPNLVTIRPADATEAVESWKLSIERTDGPTALILTRQKVPLIDRKEMAPASGVRKGGYILWESNASPKIVLIGTGSEVHIALAAGKLLRDKGVAARVVSLPSWEIFNKQSNEYQEAVLPSAITARVSIEAGTPIGWERYVGLKGAAIGVSRFGASAPGELVYAKFGFTPQRIVDAALKLL